MLEHIEYGKRLYNLHIWFAYEQMIGENAAAIQLMCIKQQQQQLRYNIDRSNFNCLLNVLELSVWDSRGMATEQFLSTLNSFQIEDVAQIVSHSL